MHLTDVFRDRVLCHVEGTTVGKGHRREYRSYWPVTVWNEQIFL